MNAAAFVSARLLIGPVLTLVALTYVTALGLLITSVCDIRRGRSTRFYEQYTGGGPQSVERTKRQLANLFEFPVLFLAAVCLACACGIVSRALVALAWTYVAMRCIHTVVHLTPLLNRLWLRTPSFMASNVLLLAFWGVLVAEIVPHE